MCKLSSCGVGKFLTKSMEAEENKHKRGEMQNKLYNSKNNMHC
jgi:hypothetical protein